MDAEIRCRDESDAVRRARYVGHCRWVVLGLRAWLDTRPGPEDSSDAKRGCIAAHAARSGLTGVSGAVEEVENARAGVA